MARLAFFTALAGLCFLQLFVTFRGLSSPAAMAQAQLGRELARGNGLHSQVINPYAWQQLIKKGKDARVLTHVDTFQPPLPALLLAPCFKLVESQWTFTAESRIYLLDRITAAVSLLFLLGAMGFVWLTVERLFDGRIAGWTVIITMACQLLWERALGGFAPMLLLFFFSVGAYFFAQALEKVESGAAGAGKLLLGLGIMGAGMVLTHWMGIWLVLGFAISAALLITPRSLALAVVLPAVIALGAWGVRNNAVCGEFSGSAKAMVQSALMMSQGSWLVRDFSGTSPAVDLPFLIRKLAGNFLLQLNSLYNHLGGAIPALLFFVCLLHPFKRQATSSLRWALALVWFCAVLGMALVGLPDKERDDNQLYVLFIPLFSAYGLAFLAVLWGRLGVSRGTNWWAKHGAAAMAAGITVLPMLVNLPTSVINGLNAKGQVSHWPPYLPDRLARLREFTTEDEVIFTDMPWAISWYADRTCIWLPTEIDQFGEMRKLLASQEVTIAGLVFTPVSAKADKLGDIFTGEYHDWAVQIYRGIGVGFGVDTMGNVQFPYKEFFPLAGQPVDGQRFIAEVVFMSDRRRWEKPAQPR